MKRSALLLGLAALAGCSALPRDVEGTSDRVRQSGQIRVGAAAGAAGAPETAKLLSVLGQKVGAQARRTVGETEPLLAALEEGKLDLVVAWFDPKSPWANRVALAPRLASRGGKDDRLELRAAARNGENRWVMLVETTSRAVAPEGAK